MLLFIAADELSVSFPVCSLLGRAPSEIAMAGSLLSQPMSTYT